MDIRGLQGLIGATPDGVWGPKSKAALLNAFRATDRAPVSRGQMEAMAARLGCSVLQLAAVRAVEASGSGFDDDGRPKMLFERHKFHRATGGRFGPSEFSQSVAGGYTVDADRNGVNDSWDKLSAAIATGEVDAAFSSASWGAFQVLGEWWDELRYSRPYSLARACVEGEAAQLDLAARYIEFHRLQDELRAITSNPASCIPFAAAYNGPAFRKFAYHEKLAAFMARGRA